MMKVKIFDEECEKDLEESINDFISEINCDIIDIKYEVAIATCGEEQLYCFSAMIVYTVKSE
ncbi:MAG: sporulation protein Cse60 [Firmicutes bacterium]|nr:sporulation protein Cse60 [Bacillota bacterium]